MAGTDDAGDGGFLSRWSRRKVLVRQGVAAPEPAPPPGAGATATALLPVETQALVVPAPAAPVPASESTAVQAAPAPTLADVALLDHQSDFSRFVVPGVDTGVKNAALKKLFTDPHFNVMVGSTPTSTTTASPTRCPKACCARWRRRGFWACSPTIPSLPPSWTMPRPRPLARRACRRPWPSPPPSTVPPPTPPPC